MTHDDHEIRLRVLERLADDTRDLLYRMEDKIDNQFKWIIGTILTVFVSLILVKVF